MDKLTEARAVLAPKRRVSSDTLMTDSLTLEPPIVALGNNVSKPAHRYEGASRTIQWNMQAELLSKLLLICRAHRKRPNRAGCEAAKPLVSGSR